MHGKTGPNKAENRKKKETSIECHDGETQAEIYKNQEITSKPVEMQLDTYTSWARSSGKQSLDLNFVGDSAPENANNI